MMISPTVHVQMELIAADQLVEVSRYSKIPFGKYKDSAFCKE